MARTLKKYNGRFYEKGKSKHVFIGAYSDADAARILQELYDRPTSQVNEIRKYFSKDAWGTQMEGIPLERGAWVSDGYSDKPVRRL